MTRFMFLQIPLAAVKTVGKGAHLEAQRGGTGKRSQRFGLWAGRGGAGWLKLEE